MVSELGFEQAHAAFIEEHLKRRSGERRGRLERGHREAEKLFCRKVWWEVQGHFEGLHPEYEVLDWRGLSYFCDFVWLAGPVKLVIEIKGYGPHVKNMDRQKYCYELNRETFLAAMGFQVISFAYDDVANRPELCVNLLRMVLNRYLPAASPADPLTVREREILRLACTLARPLRPVDVETHLGLNHRTAVRTLQSLSAKGVLHAVAGPGRKHVTKYELHKDAVLRL